MNSAKLSSVTLVMILATAALGAKTQYSRDLRKIASAYRLAPPVPSGRHVTLSSSYTKMTFEVDSRRMYFDGVSVWMNGGLTKAGTRWLVTDQDLKTVVHPLLRPDSAVATRRGGIVVLDAGHGGKDQGGSGVRRTQEKKLTLDIAKRVARKLQDSQVAVRLTRTTDTYLTLGERSDRSHRLQGDVFVSIHMNSTDDRTVSGIETYVIASPGFPGTNTQRVDQRYYSGNGHEPANMVLGYYLQKGLQNCTRAVDRGVKRARYEVLRDIDCPAALVECGFLSNQREEAMLNDPRYREAVSEGITRGILTYLSRVKRARGA